MELVYLWVEEYKNIKNQGFNFSPRFECKYDGENLTITEDKDYVSIFPDNINITAIIGENGSGKSNLLKRIEKLCKLEPTKNYIVILKENKKLFYLSENEIKINKPCIKLTYSNLHKELEEIFIKNDEINEQTFNEEYFNLLIQNQKIDYQFLNKNFFDSCRIIINKKEDKDFINFNETPLENTNIFSDIDKDIIDTKQENIFYCFEFILNEIIFTFLGFSGDKKSENIKNELIRIEGTNQEKIIKAKKIIKKFKDKEDKEKPHFFQDEHYQKLFKLFFEFNISEFENIYEDLTKTYNTKDIKKLDKLIKNNEFLSYLKEEHVLIYDFFDSSTNVYFENLSDGEKRFLGFFTHLRNKIKHETNNNNFILLDEPEIYLHPNWQKKFIKNLIDFFKINYPNKILYIFITSHSPFLLSDLPKENIIFLDKFDEKETKLKYPKLKINGLENGNCINVSEHIELKTFGANIHTLLSNGFFMNNGLMGEFAKNKIRTIQITYKYILHRHKQKSLNKKEHKKSRRFIKTQLKMLWHIQSIIGERFLQTIMKNYLQEIEEILFGNEKAIENEIERLENLKQSIKNVKNQKS
ncbi:AAA family ATPase [Aliarcobacter butzleri]|uniref:AAA family ATPase n=1 Tax=Aliarcobacter butzleri TaxID=28197 RepID=UPI002B254365|nr:AAA family ATPase [Aliarcobacter butzleri]